MWAKIKRSIAIWLCPQLGKESNYYWWMKSSIDDNKWWFGEFPIVFETMDWIIQKDYNYTRKLGEVGKNYYPHDVSQFREYLRNKYKV